MSYQYGVSTREVPTSVQAGRSAASALPCVVGVAPWWTAGEPMSAEEALRPRSVRSFAAYAQRYGAGNQLQASGWAKYSLDSFARAWWLYGGQGEAFIWNVLDPTTSDVETETLTLDSGTDVYPLTTLGANPYITAVGAFARGTDYTLSYDTAGVATIRLVSAAIKAEVSVAISYHAEPKVYVEPIVEALGRVWQIFQMALRAPTMLLAPYFSYDARVVAALIAATTKAGNGRLAIAYCDVPSRDFAVTSRLGDTDAITTFSGVTDSTDVLAAKPAVDPRLVAVWGTGCVGPERFEGSCVFAAERSRVDVGTGFPYVSPCNRPLYISTVVAEADGVERAVMVERQQLNDDVVANGVVGFQPTEAGWVLWGENTTAAPASTDVKDMFHSVRSMMDYLRNDFTSAMAGRISLPIILRQIQGVLKSYTDRLGFFVGSGAIVSGSIELDTELTTASELLAGRLHFLLLVSPPPPMVAIVGVFEYDVERFVTVVTGG